MMEAALEAIQTLLDPTRLGFLALGVLLGLVVGVAPGVGGLVGLSLMLPFVFNMDPYNGIALLIGLSAANLNSDMFTSVLLGVPGSSSSQATVMDGYPMAKRGEAARALGAGLSASMVGGLIGALVLVGAIFVAGPLILALGSPELFMLSVLGLSMVGILSSGKASLGLLSGCVGLLLGSIGAAPGSPVYRYTFDALYLYDGLPLTLMALGLFAVPEMLELVSGNKSIAGDGKLRGSVRQGIRDTARNRGLVARSAGIGAAVGFVPGLGGSVVDWITYGIAKQTSQNTENFGSGDVRGVIAPESAASAKEGGALIPTVLFGIPGSGSMAVLLGAFLLMGIEVGPRMLDEDLDITYTIIWSLAIANVVATAICLVFARQISKISLVRGQTLFAFLLVVLVVASYQSKFDFIDITVFFALGVVGWLMKRAGWPRPPILIGFVLAGSTERYLHISISRYDYEWLTRPLVLVIAALIVALLLSGPLVKRRQTRVVEAAQGALLEGDKKQEGAPRT